MKLKLFKKKKKEIGKNLNDNECVILLLFEHGLNENTMMTTDELKIVFHERYSLPYRSPRRESKLHRSAASSRMDRHDGNNRSNYYVIVDLFRVRRNGGGGGRGKKMKSMTNNLGAGPRRNKGVRLRSLKEAGI